MSTHPSLCQAEHVKTWRLHIPQHFVSSQLRNCCEWLLPTKGGEEHTPHTGRYTARLARKISYPPSVNFQPDYHAIGGSSYRKIYGTKTKTTGVRSCNTCSNLTHLLQASKLDLYFATLRNLTYILQALCENFDRERTWYAVRPGVGFQRASTKKGWNVFVRDEIAPYLR